ncbi:MAG: DUF58 domain-containing protein [Halieaceae bacterium]
MTHALVTAPALGAYCTLSQLIELRYPARKLNLNQRRRALSLLSGPNKTNFRGRGIDFEEVRAYQAGDDIRTIDWRITARTGTAHTKMFREERERQVLVCTDQRSGMFFGSQHCCKSVLAGHLSALLSWAALQRGDRLGGLIFSEREHREIRPRRSRRSVLGLLNGLAAMNQALPLPPQEETLGFAEMLVELRRVTRPGSALFIVSDFAGALEPTALEHLYQLSRHLDITALHCSDPLEQHLPDAGRYTVTDGSSKTDLYTGDKLLRQEFATHFSDELAALQQEYGKLGIPVIEASTLDSPLGLLQSYYADRGGRQG